MNVLLEGIKKLKERFKKQDNRRVECALFKSMLLDGEEVLVVRDEKDIEKYKSMYPGTVAYTGSEINELYKFKDDKSAVRSIHFAKKQFDGEIVPNAQY